MVAALPTQIVLIAQAERELTCRLLLKERVVSCCVWRAMDLHVVAGGRGPRTVQIVGVCIYTSEVPAEPQAGCDRARQHHRPARTRASSSACECDRVHPILPNLVAASLAGRLFIDRILPIKSRPIWDGSRSR